MDGLHASQGTLVWHRLQKRPAMPRSVMMPFERPKVPRPQTKAVWRSDQRLPKVTGVIRGDEADKGSIIDPQARILRFDVHVLVRS